MDLWTLANPGGVQLSHVAAPGAGTPAVSPASPGLVAHVASQRVVTDGRVHHCDAPIGTMVHPPCGTSRRVAVRLARDPSVCRTSSRRMTAVARTESLSVRAIPTPYQSYATQSTHRTRANG